MNEMAISGGAVSQLQVFEIREVTMHSWGKILVVKIEPTNRHDMAIYRDRDTEIVGHVPYNLHSSKNVGIF